MKVRAGYSSNDPPNDGGSSGKLYDTPLRRLLCAQYVSSYSCVIASLHPRQRSNHQSTFSFCPNLQARVVCEQTYPPLNHPPDNPS